MLGLDQHVLESTVSKLFEPGSRISNRLGRTPSTSTLIEFDLVRRLAANRFSRRGKPIVV